MYVCRLKSGYFMLTVASRPLFFAATFTVNSCTRPLLLTAIRLYVKCTEEFQLLELKLRKGIFECLLESPLCKYGKEKKNILVLFVLGEKFRVEKKKESVVETRDYSYMSLNS
ncbi:hypothetical protein CDAR_37681 [Caerostris darwini]|uniref:Secreted protein n=1 Tax=Caerostris darwini TaxID=1538125 RepID=A0AAV4V847_9ARAC|nr:hypothetical protein CDAR_37681 [Caerostris darwini]